VQPFKHLLPDVSIPTRAEIEESGESTIITIPALQEPTGPLYYFVTGTLVLIFILPLVAGGLIATLIEAFTSSATRTSNLFGAIVLSACLLCCLWGLWIILYMGFWRAAGKEVITVSRERLTIQYSAGMWKSWREYDINRIRALRPYVQTPIPQPPKTFWDRQWALTIRNTYIRRYTFLAFACEGYDHFFGRELNEQDTTRIIDAISQYCPRCLD